MGMSHSGDGLRRTNHYADPFNHSEPDPAIARARRDAKRACPGLEKATAGQRRGSLRKQRGAVAASREG